MSAFGDDSRPIVGPLGARAARSSGPWLSSPSSPPASHVAAFGLSYRALALTFVLCTGVVRFACVSKVPLGNGEAYYFTWSRFVSWSYYDHPPLVAWMERLTTLFGASLGAIRLGPILCSAAFGLLFYRLAEKLFGARAALLSLVLVSAIPVFMATSLVLNPEAPLAPLWVGYLLALEGMRERDEPFRPLLAGALLGFAFLAKYTAVLLVPTTFLYLVLSAPARRWLRRPSLYAGGAVALAIALPVLGWNVVHGWPTLQLHFVERASVGVPVAGENAISHFMEDASTRGSGVLERLARLAMGQVLSYSPFFVPALGLGLVGSLRGARRDDRELFLASFSWPVLLLLLAAMLRLKDAEQQWTMVALLPAAIAAGRRASEAWGGTRRPFLALRLPIAGVALSALLFALATVHARTDTFVRLFQSHGYDPRADITSEMAGWDQVRASVARAAATTPGPVVLVSNQYAMCGRLFVETGDAPKVYCPTDRRSAFDFFARRDPPAGATVLAVTNDIHPELPSSLVLRRCALVDQVVVERAGREVARYYVQTCAPSAPGGEERASLD